jgi:hypothetical protein
MIACMVQQEIGAVNSRRVMRGSSDYLIAPSDGYSYYIR